MGNIEAYEANIYDRLRELREGDPAYELHTRAIIEAIVFARDYMDLSSKPRRVLDVGCGLGFMTAEFKRIGFEAVGIDPSPLSISLAQQEHSNVTFHVATAESYPAQMLKLNESPFPLAVINMVLHSVDEQTATAILRGIRKCLIPNGAVILAVPTVFWLMQKLIEYAQDVGMKREPGITWIQEQLAQKKVELPVKIRGGEYYPQPIDVFNRKLKDYALLLTNSGFGVGISTFDENDRLVGETVLPYWQLDDYLANYNLLHRKRAILLSLATPPPLPS